MAKTPSKSIELTLRLPGDYPGRIDAIVGEEHRTEFIRRALRLAIEMAEMHDKFDARSERRSRESPDD